MSHTLTLHVRVHVRVHFLPLRKCASYFVFTLSCMSRVPKSHIYWLHNRLGSHELMTFAQFRHCLFSTCQLSVMKVQQSMYACSTSRGRVVEGHTKILFVCFYGLLFIWLQGVKEQVT